MEMEMTIRKKASVDALFELEKRIADKASVPSILMLKANLEELQRSHNQSFGIMAESLRL